MRSWPTKVLTYRAKYCVYRTNACVFHKNAIVCQRIRECIRVSHECIRVSHECVLVPHECICATHERFRVSAFVWQTNDKWIHYRVSRNHYFTCMIHETMIKWLDIIVCWFVRVRIWGVKQVDGVTILNSRLAIFWFPILKNTTKAQMRSEESLRQSADAADFGVSCLLGKGRSLGGWPRNQFIPHRFMIRVQPTFNLF